MDDDFYEKSGLKHLDYAAVWIYIYGQAGQMSIKNTDLTQTYVAHNEINVARSTYDNHFLNRETNVLCNEPSPAESICCL